MPLSQRPARLALLCLVVVAGACGAPSPPPPAADLEAEGARFNTDVDSDGVNDVRTGYGEQGEVAGGEAHVHGRAELAVVRDGGRLTASLVAPLANFGLAENLGTLDDAFAAQMPGHVSVDGGDCTPEAPFASFVAGGDHGGLAIDYAWQCDDAGAVTALRVNLFSLYSGFEAIDAVVLSETDQLAETLSPADPVLAFAR